MRLGSDNYIYFTSKKYLERFESLDSFKKYNKDFITLIKKDPNHIKDTLKEVKKFHKVQEYYYKLLIYSQEV